MIYILMQFTYFNVSSSDKFEKQDEHIMLHII